MSVTSQEVSNDALVLGKDKMWALCFRNHKNHADPNIIQIFSKYGVVNNVRSHGAWTFVRYSRKEEAEAALSDQDLSAIVGDRVSAARNTTGKSSSENSPIVRSNTNRVSQSSNIGVEQGVKPKQPPVIAEKGSSEEEDWGESDPSPHGRFVCAPTGRAFPINIIPKVASEPPCPSSSLQRAGPRSQHPPPSLPPQQHPNFQQNKPHPNFAQGRHPYPNHQPPPNMQQYPTDRRPDFQQKSFPHPNPNFNPQNNSNQGGTQNFRGFYGGNQRRGALNPSTNDGQYSRPNSFGGQNQIHSSQENWDDDDEEGASYRQSPQGPVSVVNGNCMPKMSNILNNGVQARQFEGQNFHQDTLPGMNQKRNNPNQFQKQQNQGGIPEKKNQVATGYGEGQDYLEAFVVGNYGDHVRLDELRSIFNGDDIADISMHRTPLGRNYCIVYVTSEDRASSLLALNNRTLFGPNRLTVYSADHFISIGLDSTCKNTVQHRGNAPPPNRMARN